MKKAMTAALLAALSTTAVAVDYGYVQAGYSSGAEDVGSGVEIDTHGIELTGSIPVTANIAIQPGYSFTNAELYGVDVDMSVVGADLLIHGDASERVDVGVFFGGARVTTTADLLGLEETETGTRAGLSVDFDTNDEITIGASVASQEIDGSRDTVLDISGTCDVSKQFAIYAVGAFADDMQETTIGVRLKF